MKKLILLLSIYWAFPAFSQSKKTMNEITVATYNVSMEAENYVPRGTKGISEQILSSELASGTNAQIRNIAKIIQTVRPDVILLNEFDYIQNPEKGVKAFIANYLLKEQDGSKPIEYPYFYYSTVNTGQPSPYDLDNNGKAEKYGADAWGFGMYPGQYGMVLLSQYPVQTAKIRTFQNFKWRDMPGALITKKADGTDWYSKEAWREFPLSSKSHWDVPIEINGQLIHFLVSHPTPPTFDGEEDRNGKRNHDEIRFWKDYINPAQSQYIYDDKSGKGGLAENTRFVVMGDQNASPVEGNALSNGIKMLLSDPKVNSDIIPASKGGEMHTPKNPNAVNHTAFWRMRADYVLPSRSGLEVLDAGIFWPAKGEPMSELVEKRESSSDHRLVWVKLKLD